MITHVDVDAFEWTVYVAFLHGNSSCFWKFAKSRFQRSEFVIFLCRQKEDVQMAGPANNVVEVYNPSRTLVESLMHGSIDLHVHPNPQPGKERRQDAMEIAIAAQAMGMRAVALKSSYYPTTALALAARHVAPDIQMIGGLALEYSCGGINAKAVENQAKMGCKVVWFPVFDAINCRKGLGWDGGVSILDGNDRLIPEAIEVLEVIRQYKMVLCNGHVSYKETVALFEEATRLGIEKMVVNHPLVEAGWPPITMDEMSHLASMGAYMEHTFVDLMPRRWPYGDPKRYIDAIKKIGAEHTIIGTDMGQITDPPPSEGYRMYICYLLQKGISEREVELMAKVNPAKLLDLDNQ
jgi:hypothetical protein